MAGHFEKARVTPAATLVSCTSDAADCTPRHRDHRGPSSRPAKDRRLPHPGEGQRAVAGAVEASRLQGRLGLPWCAHHPATASRLHRRCSTPVAFSGHAHGGSYGRRKRQTRRTSPSTPTSSAARLLLIKGAVPGPAAAWSSFAPPRRGLSTTAKTVAVDLPAEIFDVQTNVADPPGRRRATCCCAPGTSPTKTRGEVRGGGRKPYKQKGTGRARREVRRVHRSSPAGGTVHGPQPLTTASAPQEMRPPPAVPSPTGRVTAVSTSSSPWVTGATHRPGMRWRCWPAHRAQNLLVVLDQRHRR